MKSNRLKKFILHFGITFLLIIAVLTYFSDTIDNMLLPKVKVTAIETGSIDGSTSDSTEQTYLLPISTVVSMGEDGYIFIVKEDEKGETRVSKFTVKITDSDDMYYEVTGDSLYAGMKAVYSTSKDLFHWDRVYVEEE